MCVFHYYYRRGGSGVKYYEVTETDDEASSLPELNFCHEHKSPGGPLSGVALLPPETLDVAEVEVARLLKLTSSTVESCEHVAMIRWVTDCLRSLHSRCLLSSALALDEKQTPHMTCDPRNSHLFLSFLSSCYVVKQWLPFPSS